MPTHVLMELDTVKVKNRPEGERSEGAPRGFSVGFRFFGLYFGQCNGHFPNVFLSSSGQT